MINAGRKRLTSHELASIWGISPSTLVNWRATGRGPRFVKIGRAVRYRMSDIIAFENKYLVQSDRT